MKLSACYWHPNKNNFITDFYNDDFVSMNIFNYLEKHGNMTKSLFFYHEPINYKHYNFGGVCFMNQFFRSLNSLVSSYKCFSKESCFLFNAFVSEASFDIEYIKEFRFYLKCNVTEKFEIMCIYQ